MGCVFQSSYVDQALHILEECGHQDELIQAIKNCKDSENKQAISKQIVDLDRATGTGINHYCERARNHLAASMRGENPYEGYSPRIPNGVFLKPGQPNMDMLEEAGLKELKNVGFVLIAGGLGERLGYSGIKINLPVCLIEEDYCYLKYYANYVLACQQRALEMMPAEEQTGFHVPFCIMVSNDTHDRTMALLQANDYFGLQKAHVDIIKQENVPALINNDATIAWDKESFKIITKPHGHGDVHQLLYHSGVAKKWMDLGKEWMVFIQDTNAMALKAIPSILGMSRTQNWLMNTVCLPRLPGEQMGAICKLVNENDPMKELVINVEYNQLDALLKAKWNKDGDIKNEDGYSYFPGNSNTLVFKIPEYYANLKETKGQIPEFVNPKYANEEKTVFKSPTRLECMMQDYPKLLKSSGEVGFTMYEPWYCYTPAKNNIIDAAKCIQKGIPSYGAAEAEYNFYNWTNKMLQIAGANIEIEKSMKKYNDMSFAFGPKILLDPQCCLTFKDIKDKFQGVKISKEATIILRDGTKLEQGTKVGKETLICHKGEITKQPAITFEACTDEDAEVFRIRGYKTAKL